MDLIDRAAVIEALRNTPMSVNGCVPVSEAIIAMANMDRINKVIEEQPTIEAVPLEPLCEWLANSFSDPPCCVLENVRCKMECRGFTQMDYSECWRYVLTKWMEGLDAAN